MEEETDRIFKILSEGNTEKRFEELKKYLQENPDSVNSFDDDGNSSLSRVCEKGFLDCISLLIEYGADVNIENCDESTPLFSCFLNDDLNPERRLECVRLLLDKGANVFKACNLDITPLMVACTAMDLNCVKEILRSYTCEKKNDKSQFSKKIVKGKNDEDSNEAVSNSHCSDTASEHEDDDINYTDHEGETALLHCLNSENFPEKQAECLKLLISAGAKVNTTDTSCRLLQYAISGLSNSIDLVEILLEAGASFSGDNLFDACKVLNADLVKLFLRKGINADVRDRFKYTPLFNIIFNIHSARKIPEEKQKRIRDCLKLLVSANANINTFNNKQLQPIHYSIGLWPYYTFPVEFLISENSDFTHVTYFKLSYVSYMIKSGDVLLQILEFLYQCGLPFSQCRSFLKSNDDDIKRWLEEMEFHPRSLVDLCKFSVRRNLGLGIKQKCKILDLPSIIKHIILLKNVLSKECFD